MTGESHRTRLSRLWKILLLPIAAWAAFMIVGALLVRLFLPGGSPDPDFVTETRRGGAPNRPIMIVGPRDFVSQIGKAFDLLEEKCPDAVTSVTARFNTVWPGKKGEEGYDLRLAGRAKLVVSQDIIGSSVPTTAFTLIYLTAILDEASSTTASADAGTQWQKLPIPDSAEFNRRVLQRILPAVRAIGIQDPAFSGLRGEVKPTSVPAAGQSEIIR